MRIGGDAQTSRHSAKMRSIVTNFKMVDDDDDERVTVNSHIYKTFSLSAARGAG